MKDNINIKEYLENAKESETLEFKESKNSLPKEFWPTYSAFSNTQGGRIILGVREGAPKNIILGVNDPDKIIKDLWDNLSNPNKVSFNVMDNSNVKNVNINDDISVIFVDVPEVDLKNKPVHLNKQYEQSYIRKGEGDYKLTDTQLRAMLRNSNPVNDSQYNDSINFDCLDLLSIASFKEKLSARYPSNNFESLSPKEFLNRIGAISIDSNSNIKVKNGTLLFLGKYEKIKEVYPQYFLDYVNKSEGGSRWIDRVASDDISNIHMNIYNFFNIVFEKLRLIVVDKFKLTEENTRVKNSTFDIAIREALTNCLAHADYVQGFPSIKIEAHKG